jgi:hypothetical protein
LIAWCVAQLRTPQRADDWVTLFRPDQPLGVEIQLNARSVNTLEAEVDAAAVGEAMGIPGAITRIVPGTTGLFRKRPDRTLHDVSALTPAEVGVLVDAIAVGGRGLGLGWPADAVVAARFDG